VSDHATQLDPTDAVEHAIKALTVYLDRGQSALRLSEEALDESSSRADFTASTALVARLISTLDGRDVAFHNFLALEYVALSVGRDLAHDPQALRIWDELHVLNADLQATLRLVAAAKQAELTELRLSIHALSGYHTGRAPEARLITHA
jgi:hypothetical protein